jgi:serine/threonine protein kinase/TolA-binding protein
LLGRIAIERGFITPEQLRICVQEQALATEAGADPRSLGVLLVEKGFLSESQLETLLEDQKARFQKPGPNQRSRQEDALFGKLIAQNNLASPRQINECLRLQAEAEERGESPPRLGELLVQKGYVSQEAITKLLALQQKVILTCLRCNVKYNVSAYAEGREYRCKKCNEVLTRPKAIDSVHVEESVHDFPPVLAGDLPEEVSIAAKNPLAHFGKYILLKELGRGGMGVVYKAWDTGLHRTVALKLLASSRSSTTVGIHLAASEDEIKRFYREAQTAARLKHANIVSIYEVGQYQNHYFLAMEYVEGLTLDRWIKAGKPPGGDAGGRKSTRGSNHLRQAAEIVRDVAFAVHAAHEQSIIHRDIKPQNILIDAHSRPHVTDFGLAKSLHAERKEAAHITISGLILGTPAYMSPEQASGGKIKLDARTDVYSIGAILYECLTGRPPFTKGSSIDIVMQVLKNDPQPPSAVAKHPVPKDLEIICMKALEKDPERRYRTAKAMAQDLDRWLEGEAIHARPQSAFYRVQKKVRNNPVIVSTLATAAAGLLVVAYLLLSGPSAQALKRQQFDEALRVARERSDRGKHTEALVLYEQAQKLDPQHAGVQEKIKECRVAIDRAERLKKMQEEEEQRKRAEEERKKLAEMEKKLDELQRLLAIAKTEEERKAIEARIKEDEEKIKKAAAHAGPKPPTPVPPKPPTPVPPKPPDEAATTKPPPPLPPGVAPPVRFAGDGPKLIAAHRYTEIQDNLRRDRNAYGPVTEYQVACVRSGQELWEHFHLQKQVLKERSAAFSFPILKNNTEVVGATIEDFSATQGNIQLRVRFGTGTPGNVAQPIADLSIGQLVELARLCTRDDDPAAQARHGNLYALHEDYENALACLIRAKQLGASVDLPIANVLEASCAVSPNPPPAELAKQKAVLQGILDKHGTSLPEPSRSRVESTMIGIRNLMATGDADSLLRQAEAAAKKGMAREAHAFIEKLLAEYPDSRAAAAAKALALNMPNPDGRLLKSFDAVQDLENGAKSTNATFEHVTDPALVKEGRGALKVRLTSRPKTDGTAPSALDGAIAGFKIDRANWSRVKSVNFWVRGIGTSAGTLYFNCFSVYPKDYYFAEFRIDGTWRHVKLPLTAFGANGAPHWHQINLYSFAFFGKGTIEFVVDSVRLQEE